MKLKKSPPLEKDHALDDTLVYFMQKNRDISEMEHDMPHFSRQKS